MPTKSKNKDYILMSFGQVIRDLRQKANFTQQELASRSGFDLSYIGSIETGGRNIALKNVFKLAVALETTPDKLLNIVLAQMKTDKKGQDLKSLVFDADQKKFRKE